MFTGKKKSAAGGARTKPQCCQLPDKNSRDIYLEYFAIFSNLNLFLLSIHSVIHSMITGTRSYVLRNVGWETLL
jgi:hypothetical protein